MSGCGRLIEQEIVVEGRALAYRVNFNKRRKARSVIKIHPDGVIWVDVPVTSNLLQIRRWVSEQADWLIQRRSEMEGSQGFVAPLSYADGERHLFLGETYRLSLLDSKPFKYPQGLSEATLYIHASSRDPQQIKARLWRWYREQAQQVFLQRLTDLSAGVPWVDAPPPLKQRKMRRRWGSCSSQGLITLNTHLIKASPEYIDYVIIHELCHLREHNHSRRFYQLMDQILPSWRDMKQKLDAVSALISNE